LPRRLQRRQDEKEMAKGRKKRAEIEIDVEKCGSDNLFKEGE